MREEWILSQWLSSILGKNIGRAGDRTSGPLPSSPQRYRLSHGARLQGIANIIDHEMAQPIQNGIHSYLCIFSMSKPFFNPFPNKPWFLRVCSSSLLKTRWEKEKLLVTSNFSFSPECFLLVWRSFCHFHQIGNCRLQSLLVSESLKFVVLERVNYRGSSGW